MFVGRGYFFKKYPLPTPLSPKTFKKKGREQLETMSNRVWKTFKINQTGIECRAHSMPVHFFCPTTSGRLNQCLEFLGYE